MELRHLRYFVAVAEAGGISRAAERLNVSQPPLSRQIRDLENELGVELLDRSSRKISLTPAGRVFVKEAKAVLQRMDDAVRRVRNLSTDPGDEIRVGYSPTPSSELLPRVLKSFRKSHPGVRVSLLDLSSSEILARVKEREINFALAVEPPLAKGGGLVFEALQTLPIGVLVPADHEFARRRSVTLAETMAQPLIAFVREGYPDYHLWLSRVIRATERKARIVAQVDGATSLMAAVQAGQGIAFAPPPFAESAGKRAKYVPIKPDAPPIVLGVVRRAGRNSSVELAFLEALRSSART